MSSNAATKGWQYYKIRFGDIDWRFKDDLPWQVDLSGWSLGQGYDYEHDEKFGEVLSRCVNEGHPLDAQRYLEVFHFPDGYVFDRTSKTIRNPAHHFADAGKMVDEKGRECGWWADNVDDFVRIARRIDVMV